MATSLSLAQTRILVHGHRGARALAPENTIPAFERAIQAGADYLELDLAVTRDNVLVVSHDPFLNPTICKGPEGPRVIRELTLSELRKWDCGSLKNPAFPKQQPVPGTGIPTFDEVLSLAIRGEFGFNVETKIFPDKPQYTPSPEEFDRLVLEAVRKHRLEDRIILQSFDYRTLLAMKKLAPNFRLSALLEKTARDFVSIAREAEASIVSPHFSLVTTEKVKEAHQFGVQVVPWTANKPEQWEKLAEAGVDAIITDDPEALIAWLKQRGLR